MKIKIREFFLLHKVYHAEHCNLDRDIQFLKKRRTFDVFANCFYRMFTLWLTVVFSGLIIIRKRPIEQRW